MKTIWNKVKMRLPAILVLAATLLFWGLYDRYEMAGPLLLESPTLADAFRVRGDSTQTNGIFSLNVPTSGKMAEIRFRISDVSSYSFIRLAGRIRTENVVRGRTAWSCARLLLIQRDAQGKWINSAHRLFSEEGTMEWSWKADEFEIEPNAESFEVVLQQIGASGRVDFDRIVAQPVRYRSSFAWFRILFVTAWIALAGLYFRRCRLNHRRLRIWIILNVFAILAGTLMPSEWISGTSDLLKENYTQFVQKPAVEKPVAPNQVKPAAKPAHVESKRIEQFNLAVDRAHQAGHFVLFASLCFLVYCSAWLEKQHPIYYLKVGLDILLFAAVSESLQYLTLDRTPGLYDWLTDVYGMSLALGIFLLVRTVAALIPRFGKA